VLNPKIVESDFNSFFNFIPYMHLIKAGRNLKAQWTFEWKKKVDRYMLREVQNFDASNVP
jgi:hypothetical protein